jgi:hypothetical protein
VERIREQGEQQLVEQRQQVISALRSDIGGLSTQLAGRILGTPVGQDGSQRATVDRFLADLESDQQSGRDQQAERQQAEPQQAEPQRAEPQQAEPQRAEPQQTGSQQSGGGAS